MKINWLIRITLVLATLIAPTPFAFSAAKSPDVEARVDKVRNPGQVREAAASSVPLPAHQFVNPIGEGADPWVVRDPNEDRYLWCQSDGNRAIAIHAGERLTSLGEKHIVWTAPNEGPFSREVWAPELHFLDGKWHIYFAASDGKNANHLAYVLVSQTADPLGDYDLRGPFETGDHAGQPIWAIDMTVLEHDGKRFAIWSGWNEPGSDRQFLYAAAMKSPTEIIPPRVRICSNDDFPWEFTLDAGNGRGLNEAPQVLKTDQRVFLTYSCGASWKPTYKLGLLELTGSNPLDPKAWTKKDQPVFASTEKTFGVGHSCFVPSPDGSQLWHVFHAKRDRNDGWRRSIFVQPMDMEGNGFPRFFQPVAPNVPLDRPSGENLFPKAELPFESSMDANSGADWSLYGHHQLIAFRKDGLHLGQPPDHAINIYQSGEKVMFNRTVPDNLRIEVSLSFPEGKQSRDAGILFRATAPAVGYDAQRGYFVGLIPQTDLIVIGRTDGRNWTELARAKTTIDTTQPQRLAIETKDNSFTAYHNGKQLLTTEDNHYPQGRVGLRVVNTRAVFHTFSILKSDK